ncbi:NEQ525 [Nanoarchaeum equitans Kin4-M]|uniref:NEQ525 n=1 Tax=Nanoarchaeum equitans (strain Kin4-M) TaxID=228908 RepID=Q74M42_NANEQ|nr:NEQ525 [Nanoarchaeum equitans Kin4-M]
MQQNFVIYTRAKKDAKALSHLNLPFEIKTLQGIRGEELIETIKNMDGLYYKLFLLGKRDPDVEVDSYLTVIHKVPKANVRNVKLPLLKKELKTALYKFITKPFNIECECDVGLWDKGIILFKKYEDLYYSNGKLVKKIDRIKGEIIEYGEADGEKPYIDIKEKVNEAIEFIKQFKDYEIVIPFSGGKDSTTVAILAKKAKVDFDLVFVDTGLEFKQTLEYIDYISKKIKPINIVYAGIDKKYKMFGFDYLKRRLCTKDKITTLYNYVRNNYENPVLLVGDRLIESEARLFRPRIFKDEFLVAQPIKFFSYADEQILLEKENIKLNPLYEKGFYRVGCNVCPFLDNYEKSIPL